MSKKLTFYVDEDFDAAFDLNHLNGVDTDDDNAIGLNCNVLLKKLGIDRTMETKHNDDVFAKVDLTIDSVTYGIKDARFKSIPGKKVEKKKDND